MRILLANKFYYRRSGDCIYMLNLEHLLKAHGHEVAVFAMDYPHPTERIACKEQLRVFAKFISTGTRLADSIFKSLEEYNSKKNGENT